jgi:hypothetical protein
VYLLLLWRKGIKANNSWPGVWTIIGLALEKSNVRLVQDRHHHLIKTGLTVIKRCQYKFCIHTRKKIQPIRILHQINAPYWLEYENENLYGSIQVTFRWDDDACFVLLEHWLFHFMEIIKIHGCHFISRTLRHDFVVSPQWRQCVVSKNTLIYHLRRLAEAGFL